MNTRNPLGERTISVLGTIAMYKVTGIPTKQLADVLEYPLYSVQNSIEVLKKHGKIKSGGRTGSAAWWIPFDAPMLPDKQGTRRSPRVKAVKAKTAPPPRTAALVEPTRVAWTTPAKPSITPPMTYTNAASRQPLVLEAWEPVRVEANDALHCGSIVNGKHVKYTPPTSQCVGALGTATYAPSRMQQ